MDGSSPQLDPLHSYLAEHDVPCAGCRYNLRGLKGDHCPECGAAVPLWILPAPIESPEEVRTALYLRHNDLICRRCRINLRGREDGVCPGCGRRYAVVGPPALPPEDEGVRVRGSWVGSVVGCMIVLLAMGLVLALVITLSIWASP